MILSKIYVRVFFLISICFSVLNVSVASSEICTDSDTSITSSKWQAIAFIKTIDTLPSSIYWPNVKPKLFLENLRSNIYSPLKIYEGISTNFCGYAALSYLLLHDDPVGYAKFMIQLFQQGEATMGKVLFHPSTAINQTAGALKFKGVLDIRPADQMWFLSLADHFKGYLNVFDHRYDAGDEDKLWASVNYAKFNRMVRELLHYKVDAKGSDMIHPGTSNTYEYIKSKMKSGVMVLYVNNTFLYKKKHTALKLGFPTHYIILQDINKTGETITITYWDYGGRSLRQMTPAFLRRITFGISHCTKKLNGVE